jgi:hypothetical protein
VLGLIRAVKNIFTFAIGNNPVGQLDGTLAIKIAV